MEDGKPEAGDGVWPGGRGWGMAGRQGMGHGREAGDGVWPGDNSQKTGHTEFIMSFY